MPEYLAPGVFIEEVPSGPVPIQGVSTSTAGFVGAAERGPEHPVLVTSWLDYQRWYGGLPTREKIQNYGYMSHAVNGFFANGGQRAYIARVTKSGTATAALVIAGQSNSKLTVSAIGPGAEGSGIFVKVRGASQGGSLFALSVLYFRGGYPKASLAAGAIPANLDPDIASNTVNAGFVAPTASEVFDNLSLDPNDPNYYETIIDSSSQLIEVSEGYTPKAEDLKSASQTKYKRVLTGNAEPAADALPALGDFQGTGGGAPLPVDKLKGLAALGSVRDVNILCVPDEAGGVVGLTLEVVQHCELHKNRFAILQSQINDKDTAKLQPPADTSYSAFYYPWINTRHPETGNIIQLPVTGHMAGVYARTDIERGVHKAPANEMLFGPIGQNVGKKGPLNPNVTQGDQEVLNPRGINCIRDFRSEGRGVLVWGARTMSQNGQWRYINVRRLFIYAEQSIEVGTQWVVFEPNDPTTWQRVVNSVKGFLNTLWHNGALMGDTPEQAFFVRCDRTTMTQDDIDNGRLVCLVGIAPVKPAEFVIFRFSQKTADV